MLSPRMQSYLTQLQCNVPSIIDEDNFYCLLGVTLKPVLLWMSSQCTMIIYEEGFETWSGACSNSECTDRLNNIQLHVSEIYFCNEHGCRYNPSTYNVITQSKFSLPFDPQISYFVRNLLKINKKKWVGSKLTRGISKVFDLWIGCPLFWFGYTFC